MAPFLALTGFMGSGKSTVGAVVAARLGWKFVDLDEQFIRTHDTSIADFFAANGEAAFRVEETNLLTELLNEAPEGGLVVALGGGTLESPAAVEMLRKRGGIVLLEISAEEAWRRVEGSTRPLAVDRDSFLTLWARRRDLYERYSDVVVPTEARDVDTVARDVVEILQTAGTAWGRLWARRIAATQRPSLVVGGEGALEVLAEKAQRAYVTGARLRVLTDNNVAASWGDRVLSILDVLHRDDVISVTPGENSKSVETLADCWNRLVAQGTRRDDTLVALGGGVVGDLGGFVAATYQRGISLWQIPTSLLAQVDSSVGGKTAINLPAGKNLVGAFYQPDLVVIDPATLTTLPEREFSNGLGEVVKHALLASSAAFESLEAQAEQVLARDLGVLAEIARTNVGLKAQVVAEDEREKGKRAVLNLGHTTAHALEVVHGFGTLGHGEAVGLGLLVALAVSESLLGLDPSVRERTGALLRQFGLPTSVRTASAETLATATTRDKKRTAKTQGFVCLRRIGHPVWSVDVPRDVLLAALEVIRE